VGRPEGWRPLGRPRRRWEDNIKMDLQEVGWGAWTGLIWLRIWTGGGLHKPLGVTALFCIFLLDLHGCEVW
jgi:hypothetical protein